VAPAARRGRHHQQPDRHHRRHHRRCADAGHRRADALCRRGPAHGRQPARGGQRPETPPAHAPATVGQHSREVLRAAGFSEADVESLCASGVVRGD
jgi:crotonobetainyl-CoA:carnitine CoA-transferase CaiB-like acyl-CoA transferase